MFVQYIVWQHVNALKEKKENITQLVQPREH